MSHKPLQFFGPKKERSPYIPEFGVVLIEENKMGAAYLLDGSFNGITTNDPSELWEYLTNWRSPKLWYAYELNELFYKLLLQILPPDKIGEKVLNSKAEQVEKIIVIPKGESDTLKLLIRQEKRKKRSMKLGDLIIINAGNYYDYGVNSMAEDFECPYGHANIDERLLSMLYAMGYIHNWAVAKLGVKLQVTLSSTAMRALQAHFIKDVIPKLPKGIEDFIGESFMGGRTEVYQMYQTDAKQYDKNGLYGEAYTLMLPVKVPYVREDLTPKDLLGIKDLGFVDVDIWIPEWLKKGPLPIKDNERGTVYPVGHLKSTKERPIRYFTPLLEEAVKWYGVEIEKVNFGVFFKISKEILHGWALFTTDLKNNASCKGERKLASLTQQIVYGKFGQKETRQVVHIGKVPKDRRQDPSISFPSDDLPIWFETTQRRLSNRLPHIASAVAGWAGVIMLRDFKRVEQSGCALCYTDTDSLIVDKYIPKDMVGTALGKYRLEDDNFTYWGFAPKWYYRLKEGKIVGKVKGIPNYEPAVADIEKLIHGGKLNFKWDKAPTILESIVMKYNYEPRPELFQEVIEHFRTPEKRTLPGVGRHTFSILDLDIKRKQLSLVESRPLKVEEL